MSPGSLLSVVLRRRLTDLQVLGDFLFLRDTVDLVELIKVRHLLFPIDSVFFIEA